MTPARPRQLTAFLPEPLADQVDAVRRRWDPTMAALVAPHITVCHDLPDEKGWRRVAAAVASRQAFRVRVQATETWGGAAGGIYLLVDDVDGALAAIRDVVGETPPPGIVYQPHVTLVHPATATTDAAVDAWKELSGWDVYAEVVLTTLDVIAFDGSVWRSIERLSLQL